MREEAKAFSSACSRVIGAIQKTAFRLFMHLLYTIRQPNAILIGIAVEFKRVEQTKLSFARPIVCFIQTSKNQ